MTTTKDDEATLSVNFKVYDRTWLHVRRDGSEERHREFPEAGRVKSVYVIELPSGETIEQCIVRPQEARPPGKGWSFYAERRRYTVWRRPQQQPRS